MPTGPEHYLAAERLLSHAQGLLDDDSMIAGPREDYDSDDEFFAAIEEGEQSARTAEQTASVYGQLAQVHATLALAAATALNDPSGGMSHRDGRAWEHTASVDPS